MSGTDWAGTRFAVAGFGTAGYACTDALLQAGAASVRAYDEADTPELRTAAEVLRTLGAQVSLGPGAAGQLPDDVEVLVTSPGWRPGAPLLAQAAEGGIPIWSEIELGWRLRDLRHPRPAPWLCVTGTNGKTTTVQMLAAMLTAGGHRAVACGNVGLPLPAVVLDPEPYDAIAVELSSYQLHFTSSTSPLAAAVLNVAPDHLDWHHSMAAYTADKGRIYHNCQVACVYNVDDPTTEQLVIEAEVAEGCRAIGFTLDTPARSMVGVVDDLLVDRAFTERRADSALELAAVGDVHPPAQHNVANALAAAALARAYGVKPAAIRAGLAGFRLDAHRIALVADVDGIGYVDDSKATNPHAASASLGGYPHVVWIAGGDAKGASFDELVSAHSARLRAVVLLGVDAPLIAAAVARHAPNVPVISVPGDDHEVMRRVVTAAAGLARRGDTVLLAPGCASWDMFASYRARGDAFVEAVRQAATCR